MLGELLVTGGMFLALGIASDTTSPDTPFPVVASSAFQVRVDIGADRARAQALRRATVLTPSGAVPATLVRTRRVCEELCGPGDGRTCHFEAVLRPSRAVHDPIGVLPGAAPVTHVAPVTIGPGQPAGPEQAWLDATPIVMADEGAGTARWARFADGVYLVSGASRDFYAPPIALKTCTRQAVASFTMLTCQNSALLYEGAQGLVISLAEYGESNVRPLLRFQLGEREAVLIRLGLKGYTTVGLLVKEGGRWRLKFWSADYATIC